MSHTHGHPNLEAFQQNRPNPKNQIARITSRFQKSDSKREPEGKGGDGARSTKGNLGGNRKGKGPEARFGYGHSYTSIPSPRKQASYYLLSMS